MGCGEGHNGTSAAGGGTRWDLCSITPVLGTQRHLCSPRAPERCDTEDAPSTEHGPSTESRPRPARRPRPLRALARGRAQQSRAEPRGPEGRSGEPSPPRGVPHSPGGPALPGGGGSAAAGGGGGGPGHVGQVTAVTCGRRAAMCAGGAGPRSPPGPAGSGPGSLQRPRGGGAGAGAQGRGPRGAGAVHGQRRGVTRWRGRDVTVASEAPRAVSWSRGSRADEAAGLKGVPTRRGRAPPAAGECPGEPAAGPLQPRHPGTLPPSAPRGTARCGSCPALVLISRAGSSPAARAVPALRDRRVRRYPRGTRSQQPWAAPLRTPGAPAGQRRMARRRVGVTWVGRGGR